MEIFYHYSHFFAALIGIYFGGLALLSFIEEKASKNLSDKLQLRREQAQNAKLLVKEYFRVRTTDPEDGGLKYLRNSIGWVFVNWMQGLTNFLFQTSYSRVEKIGNAKNLQKKFFPSFFYTGIFCLFIVLISAMQSEKLNTIECRNATNLFSVYYLLSSFVFLFWALLIHPILVNKYDYLHLVMGGLLTCLALSALSILAVKNNWLPGVTNWYLNPENEMKFAAITLITSLLPIIAIFAYSGIIFIGWEFPTVFCLILLTLFKKRGIDRDIEELEKKV